MVRTAINVDPVTAQVIAKSDPLPQILEGVPLAYRDVRIEVQKPDFTVNPTSCEQRFVTTDDHLDRRRRAPIPRLPSRSATAPASASGPSWRFKVKGGTNRGDFRR